MAPSIRRVSRAAFAAALLAGFCAAADGSTGPLAFAPHAGSFTAVAPLATARCDVTRALPGRRLELPPRLLSPGSATTMMAKKKDRKEGRVSYTGRKPMAQSEGLSHYHEKIDLPPASKAAPPKKKKLTAAQQQALAALEQFEAQHSGADARKGAADDLGKRGAASAGHAAAQKERVQAAKEAKKQRMEEAQKEYELNQQRPDEELEAASRNSRGLMSMVSPKFSRVSYQDDDTEEDYGDGAAVLTEAQRRQKARWYAGYFKKRDY